MSGAAFNRGKSRQDIATPKDFLAAFEREFGEIRFDLAASKGNAVASEYFDEKADALAHDWDGLGQWWAWLNPPFRYIRPWAEKCAATKTLPIAMLVPAAVGSNWFREHVWPTATVVFLNGRLIFRGSTTPYPKDLMLCLYNYFDRPRTSIWEWRNPNAEAV